MLPALAVMGAGTLLNAGMQYYGMQQAAGATRDAMDASRAANQAATTAAAGQAAPFIQAQNAGLGYVQGVLGLYPSEQPNAMNFVPQGLNMIDYVLRPGGVGGANDSEVMANFQAMSPADQLRILQQAHANEWDSGARDQIAGMIQAFGPQVQNYAAQKEAYYAGGVNGQLPTFNRENIQDFRYGGNIPTYDRPQDLASLQMATPFTRADLAKDEGFNFALETGLGSIASQMSGVGMGQSGKAEKDKMRFATGLANQFFSEREAARNQMIAMNNQTAQALNAQNIGLGQAEFQSRFGKEASQYERALQQLQLNNQNYLTKYGTAYQAAIDKLNIAQNMGVAGAQIAGQAGQNALASANQAAATAMQGGSNLAQLQMGSANAIGNAAQSLGQLPLLYNLLGDKGSTPSPAATAASTPGVSIGASRGNFNPYG